MSAIRITAMLCITVLVILTGAIVHSNSQDRYIILPQNNSMFIFDRKTSAVNYCTADQCKLVMPYGSAGTPGMNPAMMMPGMSMASMPMPQGFQPFTTPGSDSNSMMLLSTSMNNPMTAGNNNPMMMLAHMQAAQAASASAQKGGFSSLQNQPSWMNMMAMMQPAAAVQSNAIEAQSPLVPVAMKTGGKKAPLQQHRAQKAPAINEESSEDSAEPYEAPASYSSDEDTSSNSDTDESDDIDDDE